jgi:orotate phosphoribosyltransferase
MNTERLRSLIEDRCLLTEGDFVLSTGQKSAFYFDCKRITLDGEGLTLIADMILEEIDKLPEIPEAVGGLTMGADFITAAIIMRAHQTNRRIVQGTIARKGPKEHGTRKKVENELPAGTSVVLVDDVVTSGNSIIKAGEEFEAEGYRVVGAIAIVDREQGGMRKLEERFGWATALFKASNFPRLVELQRHGAPKVAVA